MKINKYISLVAICLVVFSTNCKKQHDLKDNIKPYIGEYEWSYSLVLGYTDYYQGQSLSTQIDTLDIVYPNEYKFSYKLEIKKNRKLEFKKDDIKWRQAKIVSFDGGHLNYSIENKSNYLYFKNDTIYYSSNDAINNFPSYYTYDNNPDTAIYLNTYVRAMHYFTKE